MQNGVSKLHFVDAAMISESHRYGAERRKDGLILASVEIVSSEHPDWWYAPYIGEQCLCELRFKDYGYGKFLLEAVCVKLTRTQIIKGRDISAKDFIIL